MTNQNSTIITTFSAAIIITIAGFIAYNADIITIEAGQFAAILFATVASLLTIASCTELQRHTIALAKSH